MDSVDALISGRHLAADLAWLRSCDHVTYEDRTGWGGITLLRGAFEPTEGMRIRASQITVALHDGEQFRVDWRGADSDRLRSSAVAGGLAHVADRRMPLWLRSDGTATFSAVMMDHVFVQRIWQEEFESGSDFELRTAIGVEDRVIDVIASLGRRELTRSGVAGRLYAESLATTLAIHLLRQYGTSARPPVMRKGGLTSRVLRRVVEHIEGHLQDELTLGELARTAGLSAHHFASAFKVATGISPHRYVIRRRVDRARELLGRADLTISEIAYVVGFSSQSHLTANFRRTIGITPRKFRQSLD